MQQKNLPREASNKKIFFHFRALQEEGYRKRGRERFVQLQVRSNRSTVPPFSSFKRIKKKIREGERERKLNESLKEKDKKKE